MSSSVKALLFIVCSFYALHTHGQVVADFSASVTNGCAPLVVSFTNTSTHATSYSWDLGNGNTSQFQNASTSYLSPGTYTITLIATGSTGTNTKTMQVVVHAVPVISFSVPDTTVCIGTPVAFNNTTNLVSAGTGTYNWNFGDGNTSAIKNATHAYTTPGYYSVTQTATNSDGCSASLVINSYIHVLPGPTVLFAASNNDLCGIPASATFTDQSTGNGPLSYAWNFGDNITSAAQDPVHNYQAAGIFSVKEMVTNGYGCKDSLTDTVSVQNVIASMNVPDTACPYQGITFLNTTAGTGVTSYWSFGDGDVDNNVNSTHIYSASGTYTIKLVAYINNCSDTVTKQIYIRQVPTSSFTFTPAHPCPAPINIQFTSTVPAGATYTWNFGDGGTSTLANPAHTYNTDSLFPVSMIVTSQGCLFIATDTVKMYNLYISIDSPYNRTGCPPLLEPFKLSGYTTTVCCGQMPPLPYPYGISSYVYNFGDGNTSATQPVSHHTYANPGYYPTAYSFTTTNGCTVTDTSSIVVGQMPVLDSFTANLRVCRRDAVTFKTYAHGAQPILYFYQLGQDGIGDGGYTGDTVQNFTYSAPGVFHADVLISNNGCQSLDTGRLTITIDSPGAAFFFHLPCDTPLQADFYSSSIGATSVEWLFGDGATSISTNVSHRYAAPGVYSVALATFNSTSGCHDTSKQIVTILNFQPKILVADTVLCKYGSLHFTASYNLPNPAPLKLEWYVNDTAMDTATHFTYQFNTAGVYTINLMMQDMDSCIHNVSQQIFVAQPVAGFTVSATQACAPASILFTDSSYYTTGTYPVSHIWSFGDGTMITSANSSTSHSFPNPGSFSIKEVVTDNIGCKDSLTRINYINTHKPIANFSVANPNRCAGDTISFINTGTANLQTTYWTFGDGAISTAAIPVHSYNASGSYTVALAITDSAGCRDTVVKPAYIGISKPHAAFSENNGSGVCVPLIVQFSNTSVNGATYAWTFGNGNTSAAANPTNSYTAPGSYSVQLITTDAHSCRDTAYGHVTLYGNTGAFSYNPLYGCPPLHVSFTTSVTGIPSITWDFSDGTVTAPSAATTATHAYTIPGKYVPKLILIDSAGCHTSSYGTDTIRVDKVQAGFTAPNSVCLYDTVQFTDTSSGLFSAVSGWVWYLGDGTSSAYQNPVHNYQAAGNFPITLIATDAAGCRDTATGTVTIHPLPTLSVSGDTVICPGDSAPVSASGGASYTWSPAATIACPACNPTFVVPVAPTTYIVSGTDAYGCKNTDSVRIDFTYKTVSYAGGGAQICTGQSVTLADSGAESCYWYPATALSDSHSAHPVANPTASITYLAIAQTASCIPDTNYVTVTVNPSPVVTAIGSTTVIAGAIINLQAYGTGIVSFLWNHQDQLSCSDCSDPVATMQQSTLFTVTAFNQYGCQDTASVLVNVLCDKSQIFIPNTFTPNGDGQNDVFYPRGVGIKTVKSFRIYNRWGELVFERDNINLNDDSNGWDGTCHGAKPVPDTYIYALDAVCDDGEPIDWKGDVTLIK